MAYTEGERLLADAKKYKLALTTLKSSHEYFYDFMSEKEYEQKEEIVHEMEALFFAVKSLKFWEQHKANDLKLKRHFKATLKKLKLDERKKEREKLPEALMHWMEGLAE